MDDLYYTPSGQFSFLVVPYFIIINLIALPIIGFIYTYIIYYIPFVYLNFIITMGCGYAAGIVMIVVIRLGKTRNIFIAAGLAIAAACVLKYIQWCFHIPLVFSETYEAIELTFSEKMMCSLNLFFEPAKVFNSMAEINEFGAWSFGRGAASLPVKGILLLVVWVAEFGIITWISCEASTATAASPFFEDEGAWYEELKDNLYAVSPGAFDYIKQDMEHGDFSTVTELLGRYDEPPEETDHLVLVFYRPKHCEAPVYCLVVRQIKISYDKKGKVQKDKKVLVNYMYIEEDVAFDMFTAAGYE